MNNASRTSLAPPSSFSWWGLMSKEMPGYWANWNAAARAWSRTASLISELGKRMTAQHMELCFFTWTHAPWLSSASRGGRHCRAPGKGSPVSISILPLKRTGSGRGIPFTKSPRSKMLRTIDPSALGEARSFTYGCWLSHGKSVGRETVTKTTSGCTKTVWAVKLTSSPSRADRVEFMSANSAKDLPAFWAAFFSSRPPKNRRVTCGSSIFSKWLAAGSWSFCKPPKSSTASFQKSFTRCMAWTKDLFGRLTVAPVSLVPWANLQSQPLKTVDQQLSWDPSRWVCLEIGYIPNYSHLIGIMIIYDH